MVGTTVSHYKILEKLGAGGMGVVYQAEDTRLHRRVALKFLPPELCRDDHARQRFMREAQAVSTLDHPHIAAVHDVDETPDGQVFICMPFYEGRTLKEELEAGPLPIDRAVRIAFQIADGLEAAHAAHVVHRDIKPANIIHGDRDEIKIVDFGIAKLAADTTAQGVTTTIGTAAYMSPEQATGRPSDHRSDLFSLGIVLYEMVTGQRPFQGDHQPAILYSIAHLDPAQPTSVRPDIPAELERIILKLLRKDPSERYPSAAAVRDDLKAIAGGSLDSTPGRRRGGVRSLRRLRWPALALTVAVCAFLVIRFWSTGTLEADRGIAVLPFLSIGESRATQPFCDGLTEIVADRLSQLQSPHAGLWVIATSEVRKNSVQSPVEAGRKLGTSLAVVGSVLLDQDIVRVIVSLVETDQGRVLESREFRSVQSAGFRLETDIVTSLAGWLKIGLGPSVLATLTEGGTKVGDAYDLYVKARGYLRDYNKEESVITAVELLKSAIKSDSTFALAHAALGEAYWRRFGQTKEVRWVAEATGSAERSIALSPGLPFAYVTLGLVRVSTGNYQEAIAAFQRGLAADSGFPAAYIGLGRAYDELDDTLHAEQTYLRAIDREPGYWGYRNALGAYYFYRGKDELALAHFRAVTECAPDNVYGHNNVGGTLMRLRRYDEARSAFERSFAIEPSSTAYSNVGTIAFAQERFADAVEAYKNAVEKKPTDYRLWGHLGEAYHWANPYTAKERGAFRTAVGLAETQIELNPKSADHRYRLASYMVRLGDQKRAMKLVQEALALAPNDGNAVGRCAMVYEELGQRTRSLELLGKALDLGFSPVDLELTVSMKELRKDPRYTRLMSSHSR